MDETVRNSQVAEVARSAALKLVELGHEPGSLMEVAGILLGLCAVNSGVSMAKLCSIISRSAKRTNLEGRLRELMKEVMT